MLSKDIHFEKGNVFLTQNVEYTSFWNWMYKILFCMYYEIFSPSQAQEVVISIPFRKLADI